MTAPATGGGALQGLRILDLTGPEGQPCGRYLADLGADVILVEPPGGSPSRFMAPFAARGRDPERSLYFLNANTNKRGVVLDVETEDGRATLRKMARTADAVLESFPPGYLDSLGLGYESLAAEDPGLVMTSLTPFGQTGPYRDFRSADIVIAALGGLAYAEGEVEGPPVTMPRYQAYQMGGLHGAFGTLMALWHRDRTGQGQQVDVSFLEVAAHQHMVLVRYASQQELPTRRGRLGGTGPSQYFPTKDGDWVMLALTSARQWQEFAAWVGDPVLMEPKYQVLSTRDRDIEMIKEKAAAFVAGFTAEEFLREGASHRVTVAPANTPADFARHPHATHHKVFTEIDHPALGRYQALGAPAVYSRTPWAVRRPAPTLGQHTAEVLGEGEDAKGVHPLGTPEGSGFPLRKSDSLAKSRPQGEARPWGARGGHPSVVSSPPQSPLPLDGVRVLAFSRVWAAPFGTRFLADYGAEVIKVESLRFPDGRVFDRKANPAAWLQTNASYAEINRNKLSISLDLHDLNGQELFKKLVAVSDVVVENNAPGAMDRFGLGYDELRKVKPDVVMVSCPGYGSSGPMRDYVAVGQCLTSFTGLGYLWGQPGAQWPSRGKNAYPDFITAGNLALAVTVALHHRKRTGEGQHIELAQFRAAAGMIGLAFLETALCGADAQPWGNRDPNAAPQGIYPCKSEDRWCAISCPDDASWRALAALIGRPDLTDDPTLATLEGRRARHDELDGPISAWTRGLTAHQAMYRCQRAGVPAGVVATGEDLFLDPHLRKRGYVVAIDHPAPGRVEHPGMTVRFTQTPGRIRYPAPQPGQHTKEVLSRLLGLSDEETARYEAAGALA
jgi:crotonobetainyl-CoA:carnitine CoA-transferase CaiB-like acyl-CoA transferase